MDGREIDMWIAAEYMLMTEEWCAWINRFRLTGDMDVESRAAVVFLDFIAALRKFRRCTVLSN